MIDSTAPGASSAEHHGVSAEAMRLLGSLTRHLHSLAALAGLEGKEAVGLYVRAAVALVAALIGVIFGYIFLLLAAAFALAHFFQVDWVWITLGLALLHLAGAGVAVLIMKKHFSTPVFRGTAEEIRRDVDVLRAQKSPAGPLM